MNDVARIIIKKRVGPEGVEIDCEDDNAPWVDIKEIKKTRYERGRGPAYQKTIYELDNASTLRLYDEPPHITLKNPDDEEQKIEYLKDKGENHGTIRRLTIECGRGRFYSKKKIEFDNTEENEKRKVRSQIVTNEDTGDTIEVERITHFTVKTGRGPAYQQKRVIPTNSEEEIEASEGDCKEIAES